MKASARLVVFALGRCHFAVPLDHVQCVVAAVAITPLPGVPPVVLGIIDLHGEIVPVLDFRQRLHRPVVPVSITDQFVVTRTSLRKIALLANYSIGVIERNPADISQTGVIEPGGERYEGVTSLGDDLILIHDVEKFLSGSESHALDRALETVQ